MRTTVTFDQDVYAQLKRLGANQDFKPFVNRVLRLGLDALEQRLSTTASTNVFTLPSFSCKPRGFDVDNVHRLLDDLDGVR
jgi:hypothetical protein